MLAKQKGAPRVFVYAGTPEAIVEKAKKDRAIVESYVAKLEAVLATDDSPATHVRVRFREGAIRDLQRTALYATVPPSVHLRSIRQDGECLPQGIEGLYCGNICDGASEKARDEWRSLRDAFLATLDEVMLSDYVEADLWARAYAVDVAELASARARLRYYSRVLGNDRLRSHVRNLPDPSTGAAFRYVDSIYLKRMPAQLPLLSPVDEAQAGAEPTPCTLDEAVMAHIRLGEAASRTGDTDVAGIEARRTLQLRADAVPAYLLIARDDIRRGRDDHALATLGLVLDGIDEPPLPAIEPRSAEALELRGLVLLARGQKLQARNALTRAAGLRGDLVGAPLWLGADALATEDVESAVIWLERAHRLAPDDLTADVLLGTAYRMSGRAVEALPLLETAVARDPTSAPARMGLGLLLLTSPTVGQSDFERLDRAYRELEKARELISPTAGGDSYQEALDWARFARFEAEAAAQTRAP